MSWFFIGHFPKLGCNYQVDYVAKHITTINIKIKNLKVSQLCEGVMVININGITTLGLYRTCILAISRCYTNCYVELMCKHSITKVTKWKVEF